MTLNLNFFNLLTLIFVAAKLFNVIDWDWWLVLLPTIVTVGLFTAVVALALVLPIKRSKK
jgi:hypothetical protein